MCDKFKEELQGKTKTNITTAQVNADNVPELVALMKEYKPDIMGIEKLFFNRNVTTAIPVGQARGVVLLAAAKNNIPIVERTPMQIKQDVTGYGKADKKQVIYMVTKLLHLPEPPKPDDTADALAVAICTTYCMGNAAFRNSIS